MGKFEAVGGLEYIAELPDKVRTTANVEQYIKIVEEKSVEKKAAAKKAAPKAEKPAAPKAKASSSAKTTVKSTQRKQG